jgi:hypothetical protein
MKHWPLKLIPGHGECFKVEFWLPYKIFPLCFVMNFKKSLHLTPVIPASWEVQIRGSGSRPACAVNTRIYMKYKEQKGPGRL